MSSSPEVEEVLWAEIFGCVKYLKLPYETVMAMPINVRKYWILKHNKETEKEQKELKDGNSSSSVSNASINTYAKLEQEKIKNER